MMNPNKIRTPLGFQVWWQNFWTYWDMICRACQIVLIIQAGIFLVLLFCMIILTQDYLMVWSYIKATVSSSLLISQVIEISWHGAWYEDTASNAAVYLGDAVGQELFRNVHLAAIYSCWVWILVPFGAFKFKKDAAKLREPRHISGSRFASIKEIRRNIKKTGGGTIGIGSDVIMASNTENEHLFATGRSGSGKTSLVKQLIADIRKRDGKAVIHDPQGGILSSFYDPAKDIIFNPADQRHCGWSIMRELQTYMDIDAVAQSLVPEAHNQDIFWHNAARAVFAGCLHNLNLSGEKQNAAIWNFLQQDGKDITAALKATKQPGWKYIEDASSKQAASVFATLQQFIHCFQIMGNTDGDGDFTVTKWLEDPRGGFIFITNYEDIRDTLRPVLSLFIDLLGRRLLSLPNSDTRRIYFVIDELATLQRLPTLINLLTRSRAKGGCCFLYNQEISPLDRRYSKEERDSIMNNCGTKIIMSAKDPNTAEFCSKLVGQTEIEEVQYVTNIVATNKMRGTASVSRRMRIKPLVLPSQIQHELGVGPNGSQDYSFYLLLNRQHVIKTTTKKIDLPQIAPEFLLRQELRLDQIKAEYNKIQAEAEAKQAGAGQERADIQLKIQHIDKTAQMKKTDWITQGKGGVLDFKEMDF